MKRVTLGDISTIISGGTPSRANDEYWRKEIPWVKTAQIKNNAITESDIDEWISQLGLKNSSARIVPAGTILMAMYGQGKTRGQVAILNIDAAINQACAAILLNQGACTNFVFQQLLLRYNTIRNLSNEGSQKNLNAGIIRSISLPLPEITEQEKIAEILTTWDAAIEKTERLIAAKEGRYLWLLKELINKGTEKNGWKKAKLGTLFEEVAEKVGDRELTPFSISAGIGFVSQKEKWGKDIAGQQYQNYTRLKSGEFAYNKGNSKKYNCGCVYLLRDYEEICVPNVFICFRRKDNSVHPEFYEHYFIADNHVRELRKYISSGARSDGLLNLSKSDFFKIRVPFPPPEKQKFIADVLSTARQEIELHKKQLAALQKQKRGLMQKLLTGQWRVDSLIKAEGNNDAHGS